MYDQIVGALMILLGVSWLIWYAYETHKSRNQPRISWKIPLENEKPTAVDPEPHK